jgi:hypothetical protein
VKGKVGALFTRLLARVGLSLATHIGTSLLHIHAKVESAVFLSEPGISISKQSTKAFTDRL